MKSIWNMSSDVDVKQNKGLSNGSSIPEDMLKSWSYFCIFFRSQYFSMYDEWEWYW